MNSRLLQTEEIIALARVWFLKKFSLENLQHSSCAKNSARGLCEKEVSVVLGPTVFTVKLNNVKLNVFNNKERG